MKNDKIGWSDLNWVMKVGIIGGWVVLIIYLLSFLIGFFLGMVGG